MTEDLTSTKSELLSFQQLYERSCQRYTTLQDSINELKANAVILYKQKADLNTAKNDIESKLSYEIQCKSNLLTSESKRITSIQTSAKRSIDLLEREKSELMQSIQSLQKDYLEKMKNAVESEAMTRHEVQSVVTKLQNKIRENESEINCIKAKFSDQSLSYETEITRLRHESELCRADADQVAREKAALLDKAISAESRGKEMKEAVSVLKERLTCGEKKILILTDQLKLSKDQNLTLQEKFDTIKGQLESQAEIHRDEIQKLKLENGNYNRKARKITKAEVS